jgi:GNAT superfamily N-acetyltransferase
MGTVTEHSRVALAQERSPRPTVAIRAATSAGDWQHARTLLRDYLRWLRVEGGLDAVQLQPSLQQELADLPTWYRPPQGGLLLACIDGAAVGLVGVHNEPNRTAEMKRLYVRAAGRGHGLGARLVQAALTTARDLDAHMLRLVTIPGLMDSAIALYRQLGFVPTMPFGDLQGDAFLYLEHSLATAQAA